MSQDTSFAVCAGVYASVCVYMCMMESWTHKYILYLSFGIIWVCMCVTPYVCVHLCVCVSSLAPVW